MSRENVKKFYELAEKDMMLAQKLAGLDNETKLEASDLANLKDLVNEKIIPLAKEKGLNFTAEEMVEFANEKYMQLSEDDLLEVSGGVSPKAAGLALSSVLLLSLGAAAAINLANNNHDDVSRVVSDSAPSKANTEAENEDDLELDEEMKKNLDEMLKKSPKGGSKNAEMEDIEKELDKLFKGGKIGGGSAFRPGKGRSAGKNMLNRTIGKKGTSNFDFDKFLKELDDEFAREAATSQAARAKTTNSAASDFDFDKFMEEINRESTPESTRTSTSDATPVKETAKSAPTSQGTPKSTEKKEKISPEQKLKKQTTDQFFLEEALGLRASSTKEQAQQQVSKRLADFKAKFENSFKEKFKTQCDDEDLTAFVNEYLADVDNSAGATSRKGTIVKFYQGFSGGSVSDSVNVLDFAKELNEALPKMQYEPVSRRSSWKAIMSHVMGTLQEAKYDLSRLESVARQNLQKDIAWICGQINTDGYLTATFSVNYGEAANSIERKNIAYLKALKDSLYNQDDAKVQTALKALSGDEIKEKPVEKPDASSEEQARLERERKEAEEKEKAKKADADTIKESELKLTTTDAVDDEFDFTNSGKTFDILSTPEDLFTENETSYEPVNRSSSWKDIVAHIMATLRSEKFENGKLNATEQVNLENDINWICDNMKKADGTYYLGASVLLGGALRSNYGWDTKKPTLENKELEFLQALKASSYNQDDDNVQRALKALSGDERKEEPVKKPDASAEEQEKKAPSIFESQAAAQKIVDGLVSGFKLTVENAFKAKGIKTQLSEEELQQFVSGITGAVKSDPTMQKSAIVGSNSVAFFAKGQLKDSTPVEASETVNVLALAKELNAQLPKAVEETKENNAREKNAGAKVTTAAELQQQVNMQAGLARTKLSKKFNDKIKANNGIELNEANLNKLISETLSSYKDEENITVNEKKGTVTFTAKGTTKGWFSTGADSRSATLNVREFFTKLNNEATEARREKERSSFDHAKYVTATESDVTGGLKLARETAKKMIRKKFEDIIVAKYNSENPAKKANSVEDIPAGKMASMVKSLKLDEIVAEIVEANIGKVDDFKIKNAKELNGQFSIKTAPENKELKIGAIGYKGLTGIIGFRQPELIKYGGEISIREEAEKLIKESIEKHTVAYKTVIGGRASAEAEALYKFLTDNNLIANGTIVESVLDAIKDSDKEQFKNDVKHIADQISGSEGNYALSGKLRSYNVAQEKLKAIKDIAKQIGV